MQAALITYMATSSNCAELSSEAVSSGQGLKVNSTLHSQTTDTLFATILQQGIAVNTSLVLGDNDIQLILNSDDTKKTGQDEAVDMCSLLMQLMVMNSADQSGGNIGGNDNSDDKAINGILGVINEVTDTTNETAPKGLQNAASVILQNNGKAAEVLSALAASKNADMNGGQPKGDASAAQLDSALAGIAEALKSELNGTAQDVPAAGTEKAAGTAGNSAAAAGIILNDDPQKTAFARGIKDNLPAAANKDGSKTAGQPEEISLAASAASDLTAKKVTAAGSAADNHDESSFGGLASHEENKNDETGAVGNSARQTLSEDGVKGETMAEKTSAVERALNKFTNDIRSLRGGSQEIRIVLEPESLGVLIISVLKTESGISAKIKSEDKEVVAIISDHLQKLITSMQSKGITVDDVNVVYSQTEQNMSFNQHSFSQARDESSKGYTLPGDKNPDTDTSINDIWQNFYSGETDSDTTVDYRV